MKALLSFAPLFRPHLKWFALALTLSLITLAAGTALLGVSGWFLTATALTGLGVSFNLFAPSAAVRGLSFIRILARYFDKLVGHNATLTLLSDIRRWLFGALFPRLPLGHLSLRHGDLVSRMTADVDALDTIFLLAIGPFLTALVMGGVMTAVIFVILPSAGWIYLCAMLLAVLMVPAVLVATTRKAGTSLVEAAATLRTNVLDAVMGHDDIIVFGQSASVLENFEASAKSLSDIRQRLALTTSIAAATVQAVTGLSLIAIVWLGLIGLAQDTINGPILAGLVFAVMGSFEATNVLIRSTGKLGGAVASAERLHALANIPPSIRQARHPSALPADATVRFEGITFAYGNGDPVLDDLDLDVAPGEHVAISGISGSGKSTLLALLLRLADPQKGRVTIGGVDTRDTVLSELHARIALLGQDSPVFLDTVRYNLSIARPDASDAELWTALRSARLEDAIRALPDGLDTLIGETGTTLSAGQARRLCLARTLLSDAPIIALDEPTAGLDRETELALFADFEKLFAGRTVLMVTHAPLPQELGMRRLVLKNGRFE